MSELLDRLLGRRPQPATRRPRPPTLRGPDDLRAIEAQPLAHWLPETSMYGLIRSAADTFGDAPALTFLTDGDPSTAPEVVSYRDLFANVTRAANLFHALGVGPDDAVALMAPNMPESHFALWGAETVARACPINIALDARHAGELMRAALAKVLVVLGPDEDIKVWPSARELAERGGVKQVLVVGTPAEERPGVSNFRAAIQRHDAERLEFHRALDRETPAALFHTGGTTGTPKLAQHTHGNQLHTSWSASLFYDLTDKDILLNGFPLFHVAGAFVYGSACFVAGANQVLPTRLGMRNPAFVRNIWRFVEKHRITVIGGVPTVLAGLMKVPPGNADLASWRLMLTGGSPLPTELAAAFEAQFQRPVRNIFGMTECAGLVTVEPAHAPRLAGSTGLRLPYTMVQAVAAATEPGRACAAGATGPLALKGPNVGPGYTDPARNTGTFVGDWLVTGDIGRVDSDGRVYVTGRAKDVIIRGAHNIDPAVIEEALGQHPAVEMSAAVGQPDSYAGEVPVAYVTLKAGADASVEAIAATANPLIPEAAARPKRIAIIEAMPLTAIGKIYKPKLRQLATEWAFLEALSGLDGQDQIRLVSTERDGAVHVELVLPEPDEAMQEAIRSRLRDFAVSYAFTFAHGAST